MLIGVDHGNKQIKTVHCNPFVSGLKQSVTRPFGQNVLRYQNTYYTLSTERIPYRKDKTEDDRFFILTLFALAGEIEARGAYSSEVQRIQLAVGLPPAHFGAQVERFTQYFGQRGMVEFEVQGKPYSIYIEDVACFPQAYAAAATMLLRACGMPARYVVGYAAPASLFKGQEDGSYQAVLEDDNAHAWAEVYREGIGWTVVEATPGFAALVTESDGASGQKEQEANSPDTPGEAFYQEDTPEAETPGIGSRIFRVVKKALAAVALTIAACGIAAVIRRHILCKRRRRGRKGETLGEQIQRIYRSFAALQKFNKKSVCSCQEERFAKQLGKKYPVFSEKTAQKLANIVLKACYSDQGLTKKECQFVLDCYEKLAEAVSKELSPAKRLVGSLIFCFW
mgnify:CR=1 FL=1